MLSPQQRLKNLACPAGIADVVLDTDAYNEIDDQFAISYALRATERLDVKAIYAAPFSTSARKDRRTAWNAATGRS